MGKLMSIIETDAFLSGRITAIRNEVQLLKSRGKKLNGNVNLCINSLVKGAIRVAKGRGIVVSQHDISSAKRELRLQLTGA